MKMIATALIATTLAGCTDTRSQRQRDHDTVEATIQRQLGKNSPYGDKLHIVNMLRSKSNPDVICGYWDMIGTDMTGSYVPFAINADGKFGTVLGMGSNWMNDDAPTMSQKFYIDDVCGGQSLPFPGFTKANL